MKNKIKYNIFAARKKFNIINWIKDSSEKTYESFAKYLTGRDIFPPDNEYYERALAFYYELYNKESVQVEASVQVEEPVQVEESVQVEEPVQVEESVQVEEPVQVEEISKKSKRRKRKIKSSLKEE